MGVLTWTESAMVRVKAHADAVTVAVTVTHRESTAAPQHRLLHHQAMLWHFSWTEWVDLAPSALRRLFEVS